MLKSIKEIIFLEKKFSRTSFGCENKFLNIPKKTFKVVPLKITYFTHQTWNLKTNNETYVFKLLFVWIAQNYEIWNADSKYRVLDISKKTSSK